MKLYGTSLVVAVLVLAAATTAEGLFSSGSSLQNYVDGFVDAAKARVEGAVSLNDTAVSRIWAYFKTKYGRTYSSMGKYRTDATRSAAHPRLLCI